MDGGTTVTGLAALLALVGQILTSVIDWVGDIVGMVMTTGNELLFLPFGLTLIAFSIGIFMHFVKS